MAATCAPSRPATTTSGGTNFDAFARASSHEHQCQSSDAEASVAFSSLDGQHFETVPPEVFSGPSEQCNRPTTSPIHGTRQQRSRFKINPTLLTMTDDEDDQSNIFRDEMKKSLPPVEDTEGNEEHSFCSVEQDLPRPQTTPFLLCHSTSFRRSTRGGHTSKTTSKSF
ncbi:unnamed protein product, partial [Amoebophrya sp. A120]|eukprot:GSA120T00003946001.1